MILAAEPLVSLPASDVERAVRFYTDVLGMRVVVANPQRTFIVFGGSQDGPAALGVHASPAPSPTLHQSDFWVWLAVDDVHDARERLRGRGVSLVGEVAPRGPGFEQVFVDSEGNVVRLWSRIKELRRSVEIAAAPQAVFALLIEGEAIERWFATLDDVRVDARTGGQVSFIDPVLGPVRGTIVAFDAPRRVLFEFTENWPRSLELLVERTDGGSRVTIVQSGYEAIGSRDYGLPRLIERLEAALMSSATHERFVGTA